ncbi:hypothetical protein [Priestia megaterium]|uniref:hypothetical protein n=1 Tax=Priestia megaterium TaxID=1404 RepID=UPI003D06785B
MLKIGDLRRVINQNNIPLAETQEGFYYIPYRELLIDRYGQEFMSMAMDEIVRMNVTVFNSFVDNFQEFK